MLKSPFIIGYPRAKPMTGTMKSIKQVIAFSHAAPRTLKLTSTHFPLIWNNLISLGELVPYTIDNRPGDLRL
jgi:hypothetical protein